MVVSVSRQMLDFLLSVAVGALLGLLYDGFRILRMAIKCSKAAVFFQDFFFFLLCAVVTFLFFLIENSGQVRFFMLEGEILGAVLYYLTLGILVMKGSAALLARAERQIRATGTYLKPRARKKKQELLRYLKIQETKAENMYKKGNKLFKIRLKAAQKVVYNSIQTRIRNKNGKGKKADGS